MSKKNNGHNPHFSIEVRIKDEKGRKIFHWKDNRNNLSLGMKKTNEFVNVKLGIDERDIQPNDIAEEYWLNEESRKDVDKLVKQAFGMKGENEKEK